MVPEDVVSDVELRASEDGGMVILICKLSH